MTEAIHLTPAMIEVLALLVLTLALFISEIVRVDVAAMTIMVLLGVSGLVTPQEVFSGFSSNAVISIIGVMILGAGLDRTGLMQTLARPIVRLAGRTEGRLIAVISASVGAISSFMQNVGAAALFLPAIKRIAAGTGLPLSRLLMPMGFCAILGGTITMVGSSPLILLNDLIDGANTTLPPDHEKMAGFGLFEVTPIGLVLLAAGILYFLILGRRILPAASGEMHGGSTLDYLTGLYGLEDAALFEVEIPAESRLVGTNMEYLRTVSGYSVRAVVLSRGQQMIMAPPRDTVLQAGDLLGLFGSGTAVAQFVTGFDLTQKPELAVFADALSPSHSGVAEVVLGPRSPLIGKTMRELRFRQRYHANILALHRGENIITEQISDLPFQAGDTLLLHCTWEDLALLDSSKAVLVVSDYPRDDLGMRPHKLKYAVGFFALALGLVIFADTRLSVAFMTGAVGMILSGVLRVDEAYQAIDWRTVFLLAGLIPLGIAVEHTGTAAWIAQEALLVFGSASPLTLLTLIVVLATAFSLVMSNVGATVLLVPLAVQIALATGADPRQFALAVGLATSNSFLIPTHQVNALIMGPGGYRNRDFVRAGAGMTLLFMVVVVAMLGVLH